MLLKQTQNIRKTQFQVKFMAFAVFVFLFLGCATEGTMVRVMEPPPVRLANNIKKIGIINSSVPSEAIKIQSRIDQLVDAENQWLAKKGTEAAIAGLFDELVKDDRFGAIKMLDSIPDALKDFGADPESISWTSVEALCRIVRRRCHFFAFLLRYGNQGIDQKIDHDAAQYGARQSKGSSAGNHLWKP